MRESRTPGSVRGDRGNPVPYRVRVNIGVGRPSSPGHFAPGFSSAIRWSCGERWSFATAGSWSATSAST